VGEKDDFDAIAAACRACGIDPDRIVLRGWSMAAPGHWWVDPKCSACLIAWLLIPRGARGDGERGSRSNQSSSPARTAR
jgi:hypothetical protein